MVIYARTDPYIFMKLTNLDSDWVGHSVGVLGEMNNISYPDIASILGYKLYCLYCDAIYITI